MSVPLAAQWVLRGCGEHCTPRAHDPQAHELSGFLRALWTPPAAIVSTGSLWIDLRRETVAVRGMPVRVTEMEWRLLALLATRLDRVVRHQDFMRDFLGVEGVTLADAHLIRMHIYRLRARLHEAGDLIETVPCRGYRLRRVPVVVGGTP